MLFAGVSQETQPGEVFEVVDISGALDEKFAIIVVLGIEVLYVVITGKLQSLFGDTEQFAVVSVD